MIAALVRIFCKDNLRDCRHVFEIRLPRLMDDVADGDQFAQAREHDLVYLHRSLGAAENEDGRYVRFKAEILPRAFGLYAHERLADGDAGAGDVLLGVFREILCRTFKRNRDFLRELRGVEIRPSRLRIRLVDDDRDAQEARGCHRRYRAVPALAHHDIGIDAKEREESRYRSREGDEEVGNVPEGCIAAHLPCRYVDVCNAVFKKSLLIK